MDMVKDLIGKSIGLLRDNSISSTNFSRPLYPACVFYFGERTALYHNELFIDITRGWGANADYIKFYKIADTDEKTIFGVSDGERLSVDDVRMQITDLLSSQNVFADMTRIALYCFIDTTEVKSPKEFSKWYMMINYIEELLGVSTLSMLTVILNASLQFTEAANAFTKKLCELYRDENIGGANTHLYDSVFVLGNRLKNGSFVKFDPEKSEYENYNLFADIVLLSNTRDNDYNTRRAQLYGSNKPAITAAYGYVQKPMAEIVMISLTIIVDKIKQLLPSQKLDADILMNALGISDGHSKIYDGFYSGIKDGLPAADFINWLPVPADSKKTYDENNEATYGCLDMFVSQNHLAMVKNELLTHRDTIADNLDTMLSDSLNAARLSGGASVEIRNFSFDKAETALGSTENMSSSAAIEIKVKKEIAAALREITDFAVTKAVKQAKECIGAFQQISSELERMFAVGEEGTRRNLIAFYGEKINRYYSDVNKQQELLDRLLNINNRKEDMLGILYNELKQLFESDPVYRLPFSEELAERLGAIETEMKAQEFIGDELIRNLDDRIGYYSKHIFRVRVFEAYFLNTSGSSNNLLFKHLNERPIPPEVMRTFFNTCNNSIVESIWFYICSTDNLTL